MAGSRCRRHGRAIRWAAARRATIGGEDAVDEIDEERRRCRRGDHDQRRDRQPDVNPQ